MDDKETPLVILCFNRLRLFLTGFVLFVVCLTLFSAGFVLGLHSKMMTSPLPRGHAISQNNHAKDLNPSKDLSSMTKHIVPIKPIELQTPPKTTISELTQKEPIISSSHLLKQDRMAMQQKGTSQVTPKRMKPLHSRRAVSVAPATSPPKRTQTYYIQAITTASLERARSIKNALRRDGYSSKVVSKRINDITLYKVRIGLYHSKRQAQHDLKVLKTKKNLEGSFLRTYPSSDSSSL